MRRALAGICVGLVAAGLVLASHAFFETLGGAGLHPLDALELRTYDWRLIRTARPETARKDIALVDIDEYSLRNLQPHAGRWPWPRVVHSSLIDYLARGKPTLIAYDVNFADPDTRVGFAYGSGTWSGVDSDNALAESIRAAGNVILLADATFEGEVVGSTTAPPESDYHLTAQGITERRAVFAPVPVLAAAASGLGHNLFILDADGPLRHTVPFVRSGDRSFPSLGLAAALRAGGISPSDVSITDTSLRIGDRVMPLTWRSVRTDAGLSRYLWGLIDFRGPARLDDLKTHTYPTYSFFDLLYAEEQIKAGVAPNVDPAVFRDKLVFVGTTASGLFDAFETPFASGAMPGMQIHAAVADDVLSNRFMRPESPVVRGGSVLGLAVLVGVAATLVPAWWATGIAGVVVASFALLATWLFTGGYWLNLSQPALASSLALFGGVAYQYFVEGRDKRMVTRLFGQYVSKDVIAQLVADPSRARLGGQRREMTVLFSDIRGFTAASEQGAPEAIVATLNEYFTRMVDIVLAHGGTIDKFVGDMVMALFGAPLDDDRHAEHAVDTALAMVEALQSLNAEWTAAGRLPLDIGIGISSGPMIAGNIGSKAIMSYTVIGDAVNLGARLESLNKEYGSRIIISEATRSHLPDRYVLRPLGDVIVKGKTRPVSIFEVAGRTNPTEAP